MEINGTEPSVKQQKPAPKYQPISVTMVEVLEVPAVPEEMVKEAMVAAMTLKMRKIVLRHLRNCRQRTARKK